MRTSLSVLCAAFLASMYFRSYFGVVGPLVSDDLALSPVEFGWLASAFFGSFALLQIPVGIAFDRFGVRWPMASMMVVGAAGSALLGSSSDFLSAFAGQVAIGIGCAPIFMGVLYYLGRLHSPDKAGRLAATVSSIGSVGALISASPLSFFTAEWGWRAACWTVSAMMLACALSVAASLRRTPSARSALQTTERGAWRLPKLLYLVPICFTLSLGGGTFRNAWAGPYLTGVFGHGTDVGTVLTAVSVFGIATSFALPFALLRWRGRTIVTAIYMVGLLSALLLAFTPGFSILSASAGLALLYAMGNVHPVAMTEAQALLPIRMRGIGLGALNTLVFLGVSASSSVFGALADLHLSAAATYGLIFGATATALAIALSVYVACRPKAVEAQGAATAVD
ncbi:MFS transporter [Rhizobium leguminosarum]|uniref:MFS transporter n=1 Tax=Rhizobium leguminosarum TaxID=384 RepID=UPI00103A6D0C|nr:MFS transporter [Rhizobium leguminosarum]MBB4331629.1 putative MFS family arabinose efflux permease [Rhizobium leguminosarum]MBB4357092.1 putative MFS family arabinose efflux permease [Rhizobium leguminosarum]MBB4551652.1 putative MFS family arabinose efflux permease [Rhizobium leguminosarum]MBB4564245.1 putative MFS family arabinose efflux permease [Rhizobium leguminosarum]TBZ57168.1 MFS transporter [Rhizobium leguminosarum bv. viciae]